MTDAQNPDDAYAHRLLDLCRLEREGKIDALRTDGDALLVVTKTGEKLGTVDVVFRYAVPGVGWHLEIRPGQTLSAADVIRALYPGLTVTEVAA